MLPRALSLSHKRRSKDKKGPDAKELLKKYGSAYLITSISLALVSFSICYVIHPSTHPHSHQL